MRYFNGRRKEDKAVFSVSRVGFAVIGIAAQKELVALDNPISYYTRPNETWSQTSRERESKITVSHVLQMTCGLDDEMKYVAPPGTRWHYNLGTAWHMLKEVIEGASKLPMQTVADAWLFKKLGISPIFQPRSGGSKVFDLVKAYVQNYYQDMIRNYSLSPINIAVAFMYSAYRKTGTDCSICIIIHDNVLAPCHQDGYPCTASIVAPESTSKCQPHLSTALE